MTQLQLAKVWFVVGAILLYYALNSWIVAQGGHEVFGTKLIVSGKVPSAMLAIPICSFLLLLSSLVGHLFASRGGVHWHERIPVVGFEDIDTSSREGQVYQGAMIAAFSLVPLWAVAYFWYEFLRAKVILNDGTNKTISVWDWTASLKSLDDPARICTDYIASASDPCIGNATVLPGVEPTIFAMLTAAAIVLLCFHWFTLLRRQ